MERGISQIWAGDYCTRLADDDDGDGWARLENAENAENLRGVGIVQG